MDWQGLAARVLEGQAPTADEALAVVRCPDDELLALLHATFAVRRRFHGRDGVVQVLQNAKSGACPEDCSFCSQSIRAESDVSRYPMQPVDEIVAGAHEAHRLGALRYCIVTSARAPSRKDLATVCEAVRRIKADLPLGICVSLGLLEEPQAAALAEAGVDRYNHNLETACGYFSNIVTTHVYGDRVATLERARGAGLELCSGGIVGLGETLADRVELAFELRRLGPESIPVNFLDPRPGTPLATSTRPTPQECLRALCLLRLVNPEPDLRIAGGREACLRSQQPLALFAATSLFTQGYLTTPGQGHEADLRMIEDAGFVVARVEPA